MRRERFLVSFMFFLYEYVLLLGLKILPSAPIMPSSHTLE